MQDSTSMLLAQAQKISLKLGPSIAWDLLMHNPIPILLMMTAFAGGILAYAIYRLVTDRTVGNPRHPLYPLVSNPSDPAFPPKDDIVSWIIFIGFGLLLVSMFSILAADFGLPDIARFLIPIANPIILVSLVLLVVRYLLRGRRKLRP